MEVTSVKCRSNVDRQEWDDLVDRMGGGLFLSYAHINFSASLTNSEPLFFKALDTKGQCIGVGAGTATLPRFWPFSQFCRVVEFSSLPVSREGSAETEEALLTAIERDLKQRGIFSVHAAGYDSRNSATVLPRLGYETKQRHEFYIDLSRSTDEIWETLDGARRREVRKAEKLNVETRCETSKSSLDLVYMFYEESMQRRDASISHINRKIELYQKYYIETGEGMVLVSYREGEPINALLVGKFRDKSYALVGGSSIKGNKSKGPVHAYWTAIKMFKELNCSVFSMGGAREDEKGLYRFKKEFGTQIIPAPIGKKTISHFGMLLSRVHPQRLLRRRQLSSE